MFELLFSQYPSLIHNFLNFRVIFLSIIIEALPFMLIGVILSAFIENYVSEDVVRRLLPKNKLLGIIPASLSGLIFPVCECGIVPIAGRLVQKGFPLPSAVAFMLAAPVINPVVALSTAAAFNGSWTIAGLRLGLAFLVTILASVSIGFLFTESECRHNQFPPATPPGAGPHNGHRFLNTCKDSVNEFFDMGKYLLAGSFLSALAQTFISYDSISGIGQQPFVSVVAMMLFAFGISVCSTSDAFIASSFAGSFSPGSLLAFMVIGPMIDLKNSAMLFRAFTARFVFTLMAISMLLCGLLTYMVNILLAEVL